MKIIQRENIDIEKWNLLVDSTKDASVFSYAWFLDVVAENWCVIVDDNYTKGLAIPFIKTVGIKMVYTPVFVRYLELLGSEYNLKEVRQLIHEHFKYIDFSTKQNIFGNDSQKLMHQIIPAGHERKLGSQAKRSLKKAEKNKLRIKVTKDYTSILGIVNRELNGKFEGLNDKSLDLLSKLIANANQLKRIIVFQIENDGGIICLKNKEQLIYLKGAVSESIKKNGGMYLALNESIEYTEKEGLYFDFGGSRMQGVRKFNHNLGGIDAFYYNFNSNNLPFWYTFLKILKRRLGK